MSNFELEYPLNTLKYHLSMVLHLGDSAIAGLILYTYGYQL
jgi:hypothetical protein